MIDSGLFLAGVFLVRQFIKLVGLTFIEAKIEAKTHRHITMGFVQVGLDVRTISSSSYPSFCSGGTSNIGH